MDLALVLESLLTKCGVTHEFHPKKGCLRKCGSPIVLRFPWPLIEPNDFTYVRIFKHFLYSKDFNGGEENSMIEHTCVTLRTSMVKKNSP